MVKNYLSVGKLSLPQDRAVTRLKLHKLWSRMLQVARFDSETYLELKEDNTATGQAVAALFFACLSYGIGFALLTSPFALYAILVGVLARLLLSLLAGLVWAVTVFVIGTKLFQGNARFWELSRPLFFSATPGIFFILIAVPFEYVVGPVTVIVSVWVIVGGVVALKNAMGFGYERSILTYIVGFLIGIALAGFFGL